MSIYDIKTDDNKVFHVFCNDCEAARLEGGAAQLRVDVPNGDGETAITQFYGGSAIYALTPCDEAAARSVLSRRWDLPEPVRLALPEPESDAVIPGEDQDLDDDDDYQSF